MLTFEITIRFQITIIAHSFLLVAEVLVAEAGFEPAMPLAYETVVVT